MRLSQPGFAYCPCGILTKHDQRLKKLEKSFSLFHDATDVDGKFLAKRTLSNKYLKDRASEILVDL